MHLIQHVNQSCYLVSSLDHHLSLLVWFQFSKIAHYKRNSIVDRSKLVLCQWSDPNTRWKLLFKSPLNILNLTYCGSRHIPFSLDLWSLGIQFSFSFMGLINLDGLTWTDSLSLSLVLSYQVTDSLINKNWIMFI